MLCRLVVVCVCGCESFNLHPDQRFTLKFVCVCRFVAADRAPARQQLAVLLAPLFVPPFDGYCRVSHHPPTTTTSPTFISSLAIKHDLSAHFAWRYLIACCSGTGPNRLSAGSYGDHMHCISAAKLSPFSPHIILIIFGIALPELNVLCKWFTTFHFSSNLKQKNLQQNINQIVAVFLENVLKCRAGVF